MERPKKFRSRIFNLSSPAATAVAAFFFTLLFTIASTWPAHAQTGYSRIIYSFTGGEDGGTPQGGLVADAAGNLYGTTAGPPNGHRCELAGDCGTVFKLSPDGDQWSFTTLYRFRGGTDGFHPAARLAIGPDGSLYGTTVQGGGGVGNIGVCQYQDGCGTVFRLTPTADGQWHETIIFHFPYQEDLNAGWGNGVIVDQTGNVYGTDVHGGQFGAGSVYKLTPTNRGYAYSVIHSFGGYGDGGDPYSSPSMDSTGNLYGTLTYGPGPYGSGLVYKLTPTNGEWTYEIIYHPTNFAGGGQALAGVTLDAAGNVYGAYATGGPSNGYDGYASGTVFRLSPAGAGYEYSLLHSWNVEGAYGPSDLVAVDAAGNVYGTNAENDDMRGDDNSVFEIAAQHNGSGDYNDLYNFNWDPSGLTLAPNKKLYGVTEYGGAYYQGMVFEVTP